MIFNYSIKHHNDTLAKIDREGFKESVSSGYYHDLYSGKNPIIPINTKKLDVSSLLKREQLQSEWREVAENKFKKDTFELFWI